MNLVLFLLVLGRVEGRDYFALFWGPPPILGWVYIWVLSPHHIEPTPSGYFCTFLYVYLFSSYYTVHTCKCAGTEFGKFNHVIYWPILPVWPKLTCSVKSLEDIRLRYNNNRDVLFCTNCYNWAIFWARDLRFCIEVDINLLKKMQFFSSIYKKTFK